ncbi:hypothetical protein M2651_04570 [Clostridium sp. SYSU_GA19001]|uniref:hypothetical protein n=1 Tax=Clostridium caldaquaticum TaxID=2940653 RepID=UPI002076FD82|nr:hypothetical protein [Clostridium caldaquaticum]MCM8710299.1 hypothetical protein [Clostridium caldaquaticum]
MKKKLSRDLILFIILIPLFLIGAFYLSSRVENNLPSYIVDNKGRFGYSIFFQTLKELKHPVDKTTAQVPSQDINSVQIVAETGGFNANSEEVEAWIKNGGTLVYLTPVNIQFLAYGEVPEIKGSLKIYNHGKGKIIGADIDSITNKTLALRKDKAYELYSEITVLNKKIYFNESHMYVQKVQNTLWDFIPVQIKFIIYQLIFVLTAVIYYKSKRFGKPIPFYEETERTENEYLYSAAALYKQAECWDLMFDIYYKSLLKELNCSKEDFLKYWDREKLPSLKKAEKVYEFAKKNNSKKSSKEYMHIISTIESLRKILSKRRELYWNTLKKIK